MVAESPIQNKTALLVILRLSLSLLHYYLFIYLLTSSTPITGYPLMRTGFYYLTSA